MTDLYLEAHVTIAPVFDQERERVKALVEPYGFKLAHLVMLKDKGPDLPSQRDSFMTGHGKDIDDLAGRTRQVVLALGCHGFKVWRYKIESCVIDSRQTGDVWGIGLDPERPALPQIACDGCVRVA